MIPILTLERSETVDNASIASAQEIRAQNAEVGIGLVEVMIALFVLTFGALAIGNLQTESLIAVNISSSHFRVNSLSLEILEQLKADSDNAAAGRYNTAYADTVAGPNVPAGMVDTVNHWKVNIAQSLPSGKGLIDCTASECLVSLRWNEMVTEGLEERTYNLKAPL